MNISTMLIPYQDKKEARELDVTKVWFRPTVIGIEIEELIDDSGDFSINLCCPHCGGLEFSRARYDDLHNTLALVCLEKSCMRRVDFLDLRWHFDIG